MCIRDRLYPIKAGLTIGHCADLLWQSVQATMPGDVYKRQVRDAPGDAALGKLHKEIRKTEQDNVGVESAHKSEEAAETGVRLA